MYVQLEIHTNHNTTKVKINADHNVHTVSIVSPENILPRPVVVFIIFCYVRMKLMLLMLSNLTVCI